MPSSHSALVSAVATGVGLRNGFDSVTFALAVVLAMIVTYDAAGVRRQAGTHARVLNQIIAEVLEGRPPAEIPLEELLGHSRKEVAIGILFGVGVMLLWNFVLRPLFR
jgi:acid phosphatase family membrane protein YuiD